MQGKLVLAVPNNGSASATLPRLPAILTIALFPVKAVAAVWAAWCTCLFCSYSMHTEWYTYRMVQLLPTVRISE